MDPLRLPGEICIKRANDNSRMLLRGAMQSDEVLSIERENGSSLGGRKGEDFLICRRLVGRFPEWSERHDRGA